MSRPEATEYAEYYGRYISLVPEGPITETLRRQLESTTKLFGGLSEAQAEHRYAPDKWSVKELLGHIIDAERVMAYRALRFARGDQTPLPGFDQDVFMAGSNFGAAKLADLVREFEHVRNASILLLEGFSPEAWTRRGTASDAEISVRALAHILAGHELHHVNILRERYL